MSFSGIASEYREESLIAVNINLFPLSEWGRRPTLSLHKRVKTLVRTGIQIKRAFFWSSNYLIRWQGSHDLTYDSISSTEFGQKEFLNVFYLCLLMTKSPPILSWQKDKIPFMNSNGTIICSLSNLWWSLFFWSKTIFSFQSAIFFSAVEPYRIFSRALYISILQNVTG